MSPELIPPTIWDLMLAGAVILGVGALMKALFPHHKGEVWSAVLGAALLVVLFLCFEQSPSVMAWFTYHCPEGHYACLR